jgi:hypothetical protein
VSLPTSSERAAIADAVSVYIASGVTAGVFGSAQPLIKRRYIALDDLESLPHVEPLVSIIPIGLELRSIATRKFIQKDFEVLVGIEQRLSQGCKPESTAGNAEIDAMALFAERLATWFEPDESASPPRTGILIDPSGNKIAAFTGSKVVAFNYDRLQKERVFTSAIILTYRRY